MTVQTPIQIAPGKFPEPQQRALNDAFSRITSSVVNGATVIVVSMVGGEATFSVPVSQGSSAYAALTETTWWTQVKTIAKTSSRVTFAFTNAPAGGDVLRVVIP